MAEETKRSGKKTWLVLAIVLVLALLLLRYVPTNFLPPKEEAFTLTASDVPETMKVGETITISATLTCSPFRSFWVLSGFNTVEAAMCPEGVNYAQLDVAKMHYLPAGRHITFTQTFTPEEPGEYIFYAVSDFSVGKTKYQFALPEKTVTVTE